MPQGKREHPSTYMVQDRSNEEELTRLRIQDQMVTIRMGGVLSEQPDPTIFHRVLDVGCGSGSWLTDVAKMYPTIATLIGVDISSRMVAYAREQAEAQHMQDRVEFYVMDALRMLEFPAGYFDLVNLRLGVSFLRQWDWPKLLQEFLRVTRSGGVIRISDGELAPSTTSMSQEKLHAYICAAFFHAGHLFYEGPDGLIRHLPQLLVQHGIHNIQTKSYSVEVNAKHPAFESYFKDMELAFKNMRPFIEKWCGGVVDYDTLFRHALEEMQLPNFHSLGKFITFWGYKGRNAQVEMNPIPSLEREGAKAKEDGAKRDHTIALTEREKDVLLLISEGLTNQQIAEKLLISKKTVNTHVTSLYSKFGVSTRAAAVGFAFRHDIL